MYHGEKNGFQEKNTEVYKIRNILINQQTYDTSTWEIGILQYFF